MLNLFLRAFVITLGLIGPAMAQERILISSDWGKVTAELAANDATRALVRMLPLTIEMRDHLRQEKTGNLPSPLPAVERQLEFSTGTALELQSLRHLLPRRPRPSARDHPARPGDGRRFNLRSARSGHRPS
jgi:Cyclophilin-like family